MLTGDKQKMEGAEKMCTQQTFSGSSESEAAVLGCWAKPAEEQGSCSVFQKHFVKVELSEGAGMTKALMVSILQELLESMEL